jgi:hypothetical protein
MRALIGALAVACAAPAAAQVGPPTAVARRDPDVRYLLVTDGAAAQCQEWRSRIDDDEPTLWRRDGQVTLTLELEPTLGGAITGLDYESSDDSDESFTCDEAVQRFATVEDCEAARDDGRAATDLRPCLGRAAPYDDATFAAFEDVLARGGALYSVGNRGCERWDVAPATPATIDAAHVAGTIRLRRAGNVYEWDYDHAVGLGTILIGDVAIIDATGGETATVNWGCHHDATIATPAAGVIGLRGWFYLDPAECRRAQPAPPAALDDC